MTNGNPVHLETAILAIISSRTPPRTRNAPSRGLLVNVNIGIWSHNNNTLVAQAHPLGYTFAMSLQPGDILRERYQIDGKLGKGGMGTVFLAQDITLNIKVAVKENLNINPGSD